MVSKGIYTKILILFICLLTFNISIADDFFDKMNDDLDTPAASSDFNFDNLKEDDFSPEAQAPPRPAPLTKKKAPAKSEMVNSLETRIQDTRKKVEQTQEEIKAEDRSQKEDIKEILRLQAILKNEMAKESRLKKNLIKKQAEGRRIKDKIVNARQKLNRRPSNSQ